MKKLKWIPLLFLILSAGCTKYGNPFDKGWTAADKAFYNSVVSLQGNAGENYAVWSKTMDSLEAINKLQQFFQSDPSVTSASISSQGITVQYTNGLRGGIFLNPQDNAGTHRPALKPLLKASATSFSTTALVNNKKAILLNPSYWERSDWTDPIVSNYLHWLPQPGFLLQTFYKNEEATVERFTELSGNGIVHIYSHGMAFPTENNISEVYVLTGEKVNETTTSKYWDDCKNGDILIGLVAHGKTGPDAVRESTYWISEKFIASHNDFSKDTVLFYGGFCFSFLGQWDTFHQNFAKGAYFGFTWSVWTDWNARWNRELIGSLSDTLTGEPSYSEEWMKGEVPAKSYVNETNRTVYIRFSGDPTLALWKNTAAVKTSPVTDITQTTATSGGNIRSDGGFPVTARGVCWSITSNPTTANSFTIDGSGMGVFVSNLTDLNPSTLYYLRAYATNSAGTVYGTQRSFTTSVGPDDRTYTYKTIGTQTWMTENLAYLPSVSPDSIYSDTVAHYYVYGFVGTSVAAAKATANYVTYGVLYNWEAAKTACPSGWHLPSVDEWNTLINYLASNGYGYEGSGDDIAKSMAATTGWKSYEQAGYVGNDQASNNRSGFGALPAGFRYVWGSFRELGIRTYFWTMTRSSSSAWAESVDYNGNYVYKNDWYPAQGFSVRCIKN